MADKNNLCVPINWVDEQGIDALVLDFTHSTDKNPHVCKVTAFQVKLGLKDKEIGETPYNNMIRNFQIGWEKFKSLFPLDGCVYDLTHFFIVTTKVIFNDTKKSVYLVNEMVSDVFFSILWLWLKILNQIKLNKLLFLIIIEPQK